MKSVKNVPKVIAPVSAATPLRAARRHRASVEKFVKSGQVEDAARDSEPQTPIEEIEIFEAERIGESHSKGEDPVSDKS